MINLYNKQIDSIRLGPNHELITVLSGVRAMLQGAKEGAPVSPPWAQPGMDSDIGVVYYAQYVLYLDGPDGNPGYEPRPGDKITASPLSGETGRSLELRIVAQPICYEGFGLDSWKIPCCQTKVIA